MGDDKPDLDAILCNVQPKSREEMRAEMMANPPQQPGDDKPDLDAAGKMLNAEDVQAANQRAELFHALGKLAAAERDEALRRVRELEAVARVLIAGDGDREAVNDAMYRLRVLLGEA